MEAVALSTCHSSFTSAAAVYQNEDSPVCGSQVHNPPTAAPIILARQCPKLPESTPDATGTPTPLYGLCLP